MNIVFSYNYRIRIMFVYFQQEVLLHKIQNQNINKFNLWKIMYNFMPWCRTDCYLR